MKLLLQALLLTSVSMSMTTANEGDPHTPVGQSNADFFPGTPVKAPDPNKRVMVLTGEPRNLLADFDVANQ